MKKKRIQLIVLIIICLLSIGAYFLVKHLDLSETEETAPEAAVVTDFFFRGGKVTFRNRSPYPEFCEGG